MTEYIGNEFTYLLPGELIVTSEAMKISTILGSCVSVCLYDRERRISGMNHYMFAYCKNDDDDNIFRYGDASLEYMLRKMLKLGAVKEKIVSRVYGGSSMFKDTGAGFNIGAQNIEVAMTFLKNYGILINATETGGKTGRKVVFDTSAGMVSSNLLKSNVK
jgi:chemotaxis protein CheD